MAQAPPPFAQSVCFFHTADLEATHRFYHQDLGLPLALDQGACRIYQVSSDGYIGFCTHREPAAPDGVILTLVTPEVEAACARLEAAGVPFE
ncbi:MAG: VOC family protein, partial [Myxococcota bacterium]|nr:VOC family protein [Myxococcota bacterium]